MTLWGRLEGDGIEGATGPPLLLMDTSTHGALWYGLWSPLTCCLLLGVYGSMVDT